MKIILLTSIIAIFAITMLTNCKATQFFGPRTPEIKEKGGISSLEKIMLGGHEQSILIRGKSLQNPILLILHGGPGTPSMPFAHVSDRALEEKYIVVHWDQRGAGKSYDKKIKSDTLEIETYLSYTSELIQYLRERFNKEKIFLLGHSWGSYLGIMTAYRHPELLHAYIGMGQVINMPEAEQISYQYTLEKAKQANKKKAIRQLEKIGTPPYHNHKELLTERKWLSIYKGLVYNCSLLKTVGYSMKAPGYSFGDHIKEMKGRSLLLSKLWLEFQTKDVSRLIKEFKIPVYFMEGRHDYCVPSSLVETFVKDVKAPHKEIIWFENSAHLMNIEETELYQEVLLERVLSCE